MAINSWTYFLEFVLVWCLISDVKSLINIDELENAINIVENIQNIFNNSYYRLFNDTDYDIIAEMRSVVYKMALYDVPVQNLDHLDIAFINDLENKKKFVDLRKSMYNSSIEINHRFNFLKSAILTHNHRTTETYEYQQISLVCSNFSPLSGQLHHLFHDTIFEESDNSFLQWVFMKIQVIEIDYNHTYRYN